MIQMKSHVLRCWADILGTMLRTWERFSFWPGVGQNIAMQALSTVRNFLLLICTFSVCLHPL